MFGDILDCRQQLDGGYASPGADWIVAVGEETNRNYQGGADNPQAHDFYRSYVRSRGGLHQMTASVSDARWSLVTPS